jgi:2-dehydropantoate 2-reductase
MRYLIIGAGALGGYLAARLALSGHTISVVARGAHLDAMRAKGGIVLVEPGAVDRFAPLRAVSSVDDAPAADVVMVALKAHQVADVAPAIARAAADASLLVPMQNGVPWWYFLRGYTGPFAGRRVASVDPSGAMPIDRLAPLFCFKSTEVIAPGRVRHLPSASEQHLCGALEAEDEARLAPFVAELVGADLPARAAPARQSVWLKLLGNIFANPLCALTQVPLGVAASTPDGRALAAALMAECVAVAAAHGVAIPMSTDERLARAAAVRDARPSMLQDRDAGRPMELDAILGALVELGGLVSVDTRTTRTLLACLRVVESARAPLGADASATPAPAA